MKGDAGDDPAAQVDALVAKIGPGLDAPAINRCDVVLVTGPWMAGVSAVVAALRERLPQHKFVEATDLGPGDAPLAVVFVVSAAAQLTGSDCVLLDAAAEGTDVVVGVVSKIDVHRNWRDVVAANREILAAHAPRYGHVPWVGAAASPDLGEPSVDDLVETVAAQLADSGIAQRNQVARVGIPAPDGRAGGSTARPRAPVDGYGSTRCAKSAAPPCGSGASRRPSAPSRCAARSSRPGSSCPTLRATGARRCAPSCKRTPRVCRGGTCPASRRIRAAGSTRWSPRSATASPPNSPTSRRRWACR